MRLPPAGNLVLILFAILSGCSPRTPDSPRQAPPVVDTEPVPTHDWTAGIVDKPYPEAGIAVLRSVREATHPGYDRVVFEFGGSPPGYHIEYIDRPVTQCGSGEVVQLAGDAWLEVRFVPAQAHTDAGEATVTERNREPRFPVVKQIVSTCDFEAHVTWVLGVSSPNSYRVYELADPSRVVIDVRH